MFKKYLKKLFILIVGFLTLTSCNGVQEGYEGYLTNSGKNADKVLRTFGSWTRTGIGTHYHAGPDAGPLVIFGLEGLAQYVRTTDEIVMLLAEKFEHNGNKTTVTLREDAYWQDGYPVISMDFLSYYYLNHNETAGYMEKIEEIDDKHFVITWKDFLTPSDEAKTLLLAQDTKSASVPYHIFKDFADQAIELTNSLEECPVTNPSRNAMYFNKNWNGEASDKYGQIYTAFRAYEVDGTYPCTGPYKLEDYNETVMTLVKNEDYYFADTIGFDKIEVTMNPTESVTLQMLSSGQIDYMDGTPMKSKLETVLAQNGSMVHYKILDQGTIGLLFNLEKEVWEDDKVREAFQYIFDRDMIKNVANPYAETSFYSMSGMADYEAEKYLNPDDFNKMTLYEYNQNTASTLLQDAGWEKKSDGWYDSNNEKVSLTLGYIGGDPHIAIATTVQAQLQDFGIELTLKSTESPTSLLANARVTDSEYDFMIYFTALNPWGSHPGGAMKHLWAQMDAAMMHIPTNQDTGRYQLILDKANGEGTINAFDTYEIIYTLEGNELREATADLIVGFSKKNYGINFYNNVTGSFFNLDTVGNLPLVDMFSENRNITKIFYYDDAEFNSLANLNLAYTQATSYSRGIIKARD